MSPELKTAQINLRLPPSLKEAAEKAAEQDHRSLTSLIEKLLTEHVRSMPNLENWHQLAQARLSTLLREKNAKNALAHGAFARSYALHGAGGTALESRLLGQTLAVVHSRIEAHVSGTHSFYPYTRPELAPYFAYEPLPGRHNNEEVLECFCMTDIVERTELWRFSPRGIGTEINVYLEDSDHWKAAGKHFCPYFMVRDLLELILHARYMAESLRGVKTVEFHCEWTGLLGREVWDPDPFIHWLPGKIARENQRVTSGEWSVETLTTNWPQIVSELGGPVMRLFDPQFDFSIAWIELQQQRFRR